MTKLASKFLMSLAADFDDPQVIDGPYGTRRILYMTGGTFAGPKLKGIILPRGADWVMTRSDGVFQLDIRLTLQAEDSTLIYVCSSGVLDIASDVRERVRRGEAVPSSEYYFRTMLQFETGAPAHRWLNRLVAVGVGTRTPTGMSTEVFVLT